MYSATLLLGLCLASFEATIATPARYLSPNRNAFEGTYCDECQCSQQSETCQRNTQIQQAPAMYEYTESQAPLLRQVFTTATRKHDNLNTAEANNGNALDVKYQTGPSVEVEGGATESGYAKEMGLEAPYDVEYKETIPESAYVEMDPSQDDQYEESDEASTNIE